MKFQEKMQGDITVLILSGTMMRGDESVVFKDHVQRLIHDEIVHIVMDMGQVDWMNSTSLGALVSVLNTIREVDGDIRLARMGPRMNQVFSAMHLSDAFQVYETVHQAVDSFGSAHATTS